MAGKDKICPVCGKTFTARGNQKYCSGECREAGARRTRKEWESRTDYTAREAKKRRESRRRDALTLSENRRNQLQETDQRRGRILEENTSDGIDRMLAAKPFSPEYFAGLRDYELEFGRNMGEECFSAVNGILVTEQNFPEKAAKSVRELGAVYFSSKWQKPPKDSENS